jgi:cell wall-associated NlpC family hydrolase
MLTLLLGILGGAVLTFGMTNEAVAAPSPGDIEAQIDAEWNQIEPVIEQYDAVDAQLQANMTKQAQLEDQIRPLALIVDNATARVSTIATRYYETGGASAFTALLTTGSPSTFADQLTTLNGIAHSETAQIQNVIDLKAQYDAQKKPIDDLVTTESKQKADLASKKTQITTEIDHLNQLRLAAYGTDGPGTGNLRPAPCPAYYDGSPGTKAAKVACSEIGKSYVFNTAGPNVFDCSGLTMYAWAQVGNDSLTHYTKWQYSETQRISKDDLKPGDLVWFFSDMHHMAMYVGNNYLVHAPHTGDVVRMASLDKMPAVSAYGRVR